MFAYRQPRNSSLQSLVKTNLPKETRSRRTLAGMKKCNRYGCNTCQFLHTTEKLKSSRSNFVKVTMWFTVYLATNLVATIYNILEKQEGAYLLGLENI